MTLAIVCICIAVAMGALYLLGRYQEKKKRAEKDLKDAIHYEEINSKPFVDDPLDRM